MSNFLYIKLLQIKVLNCKFCRSYSTERNLNLDKKVIFYLSELPIKDETDAHLVKLTGVLDQIGAIGSLKKKEIDAKVLETVRRIKSLAIMKTGLEKLYLEALVGSANVEDALAGRNFNKETETRQTNTETRKKVAETRQSNTETRKTNTETGKTNTETRRTDADTKKTAAKETKEATTGEVRKKGNLPDSIKDYLEHVRDNPEELIDLVITTLSDYEIVIQFKDVLKLIFPLRLGLLFTKTFKIIYFYKHYIFT